jgi:hypothetical protein
MVNGRFPHILIPRPQPNVNAHLHNHDQRHHGRKQAYPHFPAQWSQQQQEQSGHNADVEMGGAG